jgi:hypothetical protein
MNIMIFRQIYHYGDKLEDKVRGKLSHFPIRYAFLGGAGIIIFWRGIWHTVDFLVAMLSSDNPTALTGYPWWDGPLSLFIGLSLLLLIGLFVPSFIGNEILISGLRGEKKITEKTEQEIKADVALDVRMEKDMKEIERRLDGIEIKLK